MSASQAPVTGESSGRFQGAPVRTTLSGRSTQRACSNDEAVGVGLPSLVNDGFAVLAQRPERHETRWARQPVSCKVSPRYKTVSRPALPKAIVNVGRRHHDSSM